MPRLAWFFTLLILLASAVALPAAAQPPPVSSPAPSPAPSQGAAQRAAPQGVAVVGLGSAREEAFTAARAIYASSIRPRALDELRARVLAGDPPPPTAARDVRDLAELRGAIRGDDVASRQLLGTIAQRTGVRAILVVRVDAGEANPNAPAEGDAGAAADAGASPDTSATTGATTGTTTSGRLFLAESGDFDAARYAPEPGLAGAAAWRATVTSLERRFPAPGPAASVATGPAPAVRPAEGKPSSTPFYKSPWFWGGLGAAALLGGLFYFASQDTSDEPIHLEMRVPR